MASGKAQEILATWLRRCFLPYQLRWILDRSRFALCLKLRQGGFTDAQAGRYVLRGLRDRRPQIVLSAAEDNAKELIDAARRHCQYLARLGLTAATDWSVNNAEEISWKSGGSITAIAASPRTARSFHGDVTFDEFAYHQDPEGVWAAAGPMATRGDWQLRIISTPNGAVGRFHELCQAIPRGWSFHRVSLDDAERDGLSVDRAALLALVGGDERVFAEAYQCQFLDADLQYLPSELVNSAWLWTPESMPDLEGAENFAGFDVARKVDLSALVDVALHRDVAWVAPPMTCQRTAFAKQKALLTSARNVFRWKTLHVDETGMGAQLAEELVEQWGPDEVKPVTFTAPAKADLATRVFRWLKNNRVRCPHGAEGDALKRDMLALRRIVTPSGNVTYDVPRTAAGHGDRFWGLALALKGAGDPQPFRGMGPSPIAA